MSQRACVFEKRVARTLRLSYLLSLPRGYRAGGKRKWPLILFLHGAGERGDDLELVKKHGIPKIVEQGTDLPFITLSPQCPQDTWWGTHTDALSALLDDVVATHAVDTDRLYLTGLSMGGYGTWQFAALYPRRFAALVPICGGGPWMYGFPDKVSVLKDIPVWVFHGAKDKTVLPSESRRMVKALKACGGDVRLTIYPEADHDSWTQTYANPELYEWFLQHTRKQRFESSAK